MKKVSTYFIVFILSIIIFLMGFNYSNSKEPSTYYKVYLKDDVIGYIKSKKELEKYIDNQASSIRKNVKKYSIELDAIDTLNRLVSIDSLDNYSNSDKAKYFLANNTSYNLTDTDKENLKVYINSKLYNLSDYEIASMRDYVSSNKIYNYVDHVYVPNGIEIKKVYTYKDNILSAQEIYKKIMEKESCSVAGYKFVIKSSNENSEDIVIYTIDRKIFSDAIEKLITIFVDEDEYEKYKNDTQEQIDSTGSLIENIYVEQSITYKAVNISTSEKIYTSSTDLSAYLLYGAGFSLEHVTAKTGDTIESIALENEISIQEFLIFNKQYTNKDNLIVPGSDIIISKIDPKIQIVVETYEVADKVTEFTTVEKYDDSMTQGSSLVTQEGENGLERVSQNVKSVNGNIAYVDPVSKETIKNSTPKIITIGTRYVPSVGSTISWGWPTDSGYTISSYYGYRLAVFNEGNFHQGLDIAGTGYGSNVYAANNGVIEEIGYDRINGNHIIINHNNGYKSKYNHMSAFNKKVSLGSVVERGQVIGYVGSTGWATGPHLHFEIWNCPRYTCHTNPLRYYK